MTWEEKLRQLLEELCLFLNGSPCNLSESEPVSTWIAQIGQVYAAEGCPPPSGEWTALLSELEAHLESPENNLPADNLAVLDSIIEACTS